VYAANQEIEPHGPTVAYEQSVEADLLGRLTALRTGLVQQPAALIRDLMAAATRRSVDVPVLTNIREVSTRISSAIQSLDAYRAGRSPWKPEVITADRFLLPRRNVLVELARDLDEALAELELLRRSPGRLHGLAAWTHLKRYWHNALSAVIASGLVRGYGRYAARPGRPAWLYP